MDENHQNKTESRLLATEDKLWLPPLSPKDQQKLDHLRKKQGKKSNVSIGFSGRTLWDWLNLLGVLAIPFVVAAGTLFLSQQITQQQAQSSERQHQTDLQIAEDQQRETTLKSYLDDMSDLLLNHNLHKSKPEDDVVQVASERTLTTLRRLDADRNRIVLQFLQDARLISQNNAVINLNNANLGGDDLIGANLSDTNLSRANLSDANLSKANLVDTNLSRANLVDANLSRANLVDANLVDANLVDANLSRAVLVDANLVDANLSRANLSDANLIDANLIDANLRDAIVTQEQLAIAKSLKGAIMPYGSKHP